MRIAKDETCNHFNGFNMKDLLQKIVGWKLPVLNLKRKEFRRSNVQFSITTS